MRKISAVFLVAILLVVLSSGAFAESNKGTILSSESGRYVFGQISELRRDQYLLDTKTGRLWVVTAQTDKDGNVEGSYLQPVPFWTGIDNKGAYQYGISPEGK